MTSPHVRQVSASGCILAIGNLAVMHFVNLMYYFCANTDLTGKYGCKIAFPPLLQSCHQPTRIHVAKRTKPERGVFRKYSGDVCCLTCQQQGPTDRRAEHLDAVVKQNGDYPEGTEVCSVKGTHKRTRRISIAIFAIPNEVQIRTFRLFIGI
jgi:hypothetical protein